MTSRHPGEFAAPLLEIYTVLFCRGFSAILSTATSELKKKGKTKGITVCYNRAEIVNRFKQLHVSSKASYLVPLN